MTREKRNMVLIPIVLALAFVLSIVSFFLGTAGILLADPEGKIRAFTIFYLPFIVLLYFKKLRIPIIVGAFLGTISFVAFLLAFAILGSLAPGL
ncbi:MAG: hypothetical protein DRO40_07750 [Thermoprotei archaeon]|nr:MAG: hypothetical protein DRO40_07750 [Thermoprotei archaeon]